MKVELLARAMIDVFLAHLIVGDDWVLERAGVMVWTWTYFERNSGEQTSKRAKRLAWELLIYRYPLRRLKNSPAGEPDNVALFTLYNLNHSGSKDRIKRGCWERRVKSDDCRFRVAALYEALELIEELSRAYLPKRSIGQLRSETVNLGRVARVVEEECMALAEEGQHA